MRRIFLSGTRVNLRPLEETDAKGAYVDWLNDAEVCHGNSHHVFPYSEEKASSFIRQSYSSESLVLAITLKEENIHIGNIALQKIHPINRSAEFAILVGDKRFWGKGHGKEAGLLIIQHGFNQLNLRRIDCATFRNNEGMKRLALALGMKEEGVRKQAIYKNGEYLDVIEFGLLRNESLARSGA